MRTATKNQIEPSKSCLAMTLFPYEAYTKDVKRLSREEAEGSIPTENGQEPSCNLKSSEFEKLVKPNPFQVYSGNTSPQSASASSSLSLTSRIDSEGSLEVDDMSEIHKDVRNYQFMGGSHTKIRSILKTGERSRFYRRKL